MINKHMVKYLKIKSTLTCIIAFIFLFNASFSQLGGTSGFQFLNLVPSARLNALGGSHVSMYDKDVNMILSNPSFLDSSMDGSVSLNYLNYIADINYGYSSYTHHVNKVGTFSGSILYANYGKFIRADEAGTQNGNFGANDLALIFSYGTHLDSIFRFGANLKVFNSVYDVYTAYGVAFDFAGSYYNEKQELAIGATVKNIGIKFKDYTESKSSTFPLLIQMGVTKKLKHAPIRVSLTLDNLQKWDLTYDDPNAEKQFDPETFEELPPKQPGFFEKGFRHVVLGGEFLLSKNFHLQFGFNYRRRKELVYSIKPGMVGFSGGLGFKIKRFKFNYSLAGYHLAGSSHNFSISTNIHDFRSK